MSQLQLFSTAVAPDIVMPTGIVPRDYQNLGIDNTFDIFDGSVGALLRQATGTGKTVVGSLIADRWLQQDKMNRVLVLAHERQLIWQFAQEIEDILKITPAIEMSDRKVDTKSNAPLITVGSRQTLIPRLKPVGSDKIITSRLFKFDPEKYNWLLLIDECHKWAMHLKSCGHIIEWFAKNPKNRRLGLTATPERGDKTSLRKLFPGVAMDYRLSTRTGPCAVRDGWAVEYKQKFVKIDSVDFKADLKALRADYTDKQIGKVLGGAKEIVKLVDPTLDLVSDRLTLIFSPTVDIARGVASLINEVVKKRQERGSLPEGIWGGAESLDGSVPDEERGKCYDRFERREFQFLSVCGLCREGYNNPGVAAVVIFRPTKSASLAEQMKGRGCRPLRGIVDGLNTAEERRAAIAASDKPNCLIVDLVGITGLPDTASTAHIMNEGVDDEIIDRANEYMLAAQAGGGELSIQEAVDQAEEDIKRELEVKAAKERMLEAKRKERERARMLSSNSEWQVDYTAREVEQGHGGPMAKNAKLPGDLITESQLGYLRAFKIPADESMSRKQAGRLIGMHKKGKTREFILSKYPHTKYEKPEPVMPTQAHPPQQLASPRAALPDDLFSVFR